MLYPIVCLEVWLYKMTLVRETMMVYHFLFFLWGKGEENKKQYTISSSISYFIALSVAGTGTVGVVWWVSRPGNTKVAERKPMHLMKNCDRWSLRKWATARAINGSDVGVAGEGWHLTVGARRGVTVTVTVTVNVTVTVTEGGNGIQWLVWLDTSKYQKLNSVLMN